MSHSSSPQASHCLILVEEEQLAPASFLTMWLNIDLGIASCLHMWWSQCVVASVFPKAWTKMSQNVCSRGAGRRKEPQHLR